MAQDAYSQAGVNIAAGQKATALMKDAIQATYGPEVLSETGSFGGLFAADRLKGMDAPTLVASTDGVGTKTMVAAKMGRWDTIGQDLVNHCVNDILVQGAEPLFFLDYVASSQLNPEQIAAVVTGCATACRALGCALLGGETAEMPGVYQPGEIDLVGTIVGAVDRTKIIDGSRVQPGDVILALPSTGLHTNGYSLARKLLADLDWHEVHDNLAGASIGDALLAVHRCYLNEYRQLTAVDVRAMAHITGGGVIDNLPRVLPEGVQAVIKQGTWKIPPIFTLIARLGDLAAEDLYHTFNMGLGMLFVLPSDDVEKAMESVPELQQIGEIQSGERGVSFVE